MSPARPPSNLASTRAPGLFAGDGVEPHVLACAGCGRCDWFVVKPTEAEAWSAWQVHLTWHRRTQHVQADPWSPA
jgi:hypothetical protein